jgi:hypothetical protein
VRKREKVKKKRKKVKRERKVKAVFAFFCSVGSTQSCMHWFESPFIERETALN